MRAATGTTCFLCPTKKGLQLWIWGNLSFACLRLVGTDVRAGADANTAVVCFDDNFGVFVGGGGSGVTPLGCCGMYTLEVDSCAFGRKTK